jgi:hypothetical protein
VRVPEDRTAHYTTAPPHIKNETLGSSLVAHPAHGGPRGGTAAAVISNGSCFSHHQLLKETGGNTQLDNATYTPGKVLRNRSREVSNSKQDIVTSGHCDMKIS